MRHMSFALTTRQIRLRLKTVTRRRGWLFLRAGDQVQPVIKAQGLRTGDHPDLIGGPLLIVGVRRERLDRITEEDVMREGFANMGTDDFIAMFCRHQGGGPDQIVTRIEFTYVDLADAPRLPLEDEAAPAAARSPEMKAAILPAADGSNP